MYLQLVLVLLKNAEEQNSIFSIWFYYKLFKLMCKIETISILLFIQKMFAKVPYLRGLMLSKTYDLGSHFIDSKG